MDGTRCYISFRIVDGLLSEIVCLSVCFKSSTFLFDVSSSFLLFIVFAFCRFLCMPTGIVSGGLNAFPLFSPLPLLCSGCAFHCGAVQLSSIAGLYLCCCSPPVQCEAGGCGGTDLQHLKDSNAHSLSLLLSHTYLSHSSPHASFFPSLAFLFPIQYLLPLPSLSAVLYFNAD